MDWKIIHSLDACELTLKAGVHLRVEVAETPFSCNPELWEQDQMQVGREWNPGDDS